jgi:hypothetical protein
MSFVTWGAVSEGVFTTDVGLNKSLVSWGAVSSGIPLGGAAGVKVLTSKLVCAAIAAFSAATASAAFVSASAAGDFAVSAVFDVSDAAFEELSLADDEDPLLEPELPTESTPIGDSLATQDFEPGPVYH